MEKVGKEGVITVQVTVIRRTHTRARTQRHPHTRTPGHACRTARPSRTSLRSSRA
jgi:hypothetical protein